MDLIIHKLLSDAGILLSEIWQALWHGEQYKPQDKSQITAVKLSSSGTTHPMP